MREELGVITNAYIKNRESRGWSLTLEIELLIGYIQHVLPLSSAAQFLDKIDVTELSQLVGKPCICTGTENEAFFDRMK